MRSGLGWTSRSYPWSLDAAFPREWGAGERCYRGAARPEAGKQCRDAEARGCLEEPLKEMLRGLGQLILPLCASSVKLEVILHGSLNSFSELNCCDSFLCRRPRTVSCPGT